MIVKIGTDLLGPFKTVDVLADRLRCDNTDLPFNVIGSYEILEDDSLIPQKPIAIIVPDQVTVVQLKLALLQLGYLDAVETDIPALGRSAQIKWGDSRRPVRRHDELVIAMRDIRLWTDDVVDNIFILAATL